MMTDVGGTGQYADELPPMVTTAPGSAFTIPGVELTPSMLPSVSGPVASPLPGWGAVFGPSPAGGTPTALVVVVAAVVGWMLWRER